MQPWERKHLTRAACAAAALACCALTWTHGTTNQGRVELFAEVDVSFFPFAQLTASKVGGWGGERVAREGNGDFKRGFLHVPAGWEAGQD